MDLISRKAAIEAMKKWATQPVIMKSRYFEPKGKAIVLDMMGVVKEQPSVPAVPLDKLCEMLSKSNVNVPCNDDCEGCEAFDGTGNTVNFWKVTLTKWMEEQHAVD